MFVVFNEDKINMNITHGKTVLVVLGILNVCVLILCVVSVV